MGTERVKLKRKSLACVANEKVTSTEMTNMEGGASLREKGRHSVGCAKSGGPAGASSEGAAAVRNARYSPFRTKTSHHFLESNDM